MDTPPAGGLLARINARRAHPATVACMGAHTPEWHGCPDATEHSYHGEPRHSAECISPCESCHLTPEQREAGTWQRAHARRFTARDMTGQAY